MCGNEGWRRIPSAPANPSRYPSVPSPGWGSSLPLTYLSPLFLLLVSLYCPLQSSSSLVMAAVPGSDGASLNRDSAELDKQLSRESLEHNFPERCARCDLPASEVGSSPLISSLSALCRSSLLSEPVPGIGSCPVPGNGGAKNFPSSHSTPCPRALLVRNEATECRKRGVRGSMQGFRCHACHDPMFHRMERLAQVFMVLCGSKSAGCWGKAGEYTRQGEDPGASQNRSARAHMRTPATRKHPGGLEFCSHRQMH